MDRERRDGRLLVRESAHAHRFELRDLLWSRDVHQLELRRCAPRGKRPGLAVEPRVRSVGAKPELREVEARPGVTHGAGHGGDRSRRSVRPQRDAGEVDEVRFVDGAPGVFGVTTIASARRRGYATALTRASILADPALPSVLAPSAMAERMYERLGYRRVGELRAWIKATPGR